MLKKEHIPHEVLNAKNHQREAEIIAKAGELGAVTIATNMAGRGTDIKLTEETKKLGGLFVLGTERHESRRIDNQLRGRAGRQGDAGTTLFCVSCEDDLMVRFGGDTFKALLSRISGDEGDIPFQMKRFAKFVENAQKRVEGNNFDIRKQLLEYDDVINKHREMIYKKRNDILDLPDIHQTVLNNFYNYVDILITDHLNQNDRLTEDDVHEILETVNGQILRHDIKMDDVQNKNAADLKEYIYNRIIEEYEAKIKDLPAELVSEFEKAISLRVIDIHWMEHINTMAHLREGIYLRGYAQEDPLRAYTNEGFELFEDLLDTIDKEITTYLMNAEIRQNVERKQVIKGEAVTDQEKVKKQQPKRSQKIGRNDPCPCGSGKKYKNCHGK